MCHLFLETKSQELHRLGSAFENLQNRKDDGGLANLDNNSQRFGKNAGYTYLETPSCKRPLDQEVSSRRHLLNIVLESRPERICVAIISSIATEERFYIINIDFERLEETP